MMKNIISIGLIFLFASCSNDDDGLAIIPACGVSNPIIELAWLKTETENRAANQTEFSQYDYITQGEFNGDTVFLYKNCNPLANSVVPVLNCEGTMIGILSLEIPPEEILEETLIWKNQDSSCDLEVFMD